MAFKTGEDEQNTQNQVQKTNYDLILEQAKNKYNAYGVGYTITTDKSKNDGYTYTIEVLGSNSKKFLGEIQSEIKRLGGTSSSITVEQREFQGKTTNYYIVRFNAEQTSSQNPFFKKTEPDKPSESKTVVVENPPEKKVVGESNEFYTPVVSQYTPTWALEAIKFAQETWVGEDGKQLADRKSGKKLWQYLEENIAPILNSEGCKWDEAYKKQFMNYFAAIATFLPEYDLEAYLKPNLENRGHSLVSTLATWDGTNAVAAMHEIYRVTSGDLRPADELSQSGALMDGATLGELKNKFMLPVYDESTDTVNDFNARTVCRQGQLAFVLASAPTIIAMNKNMEDIRKIFTEIAAWDDFALMKKNGVQGVENIYGLIVPAFARLPEYEGSMAKDGMLARIFKYISENSDRLHKVKWDGDLDKYLGGISAYSDLNRQDFKVSPDGYLILDLNRIENITYVAIVDSYVPDFSVKPATNVYESKSWVSGYWWNNKGYGSTGKTHQNMGTWINPNTGKMEYENGDPVLTGRVRTVGKRLDDYTPSYTYAMITPYMKDGKMQYDSKIYDRSKGEFISYDKDKIGLTNDALSSKKIPEWSNPLFRGNSLATGKLFEHKTYDVNGDLVEKSKDYNVDIGATIGQNSTDSERYMFDIIAFSDYRSKSGTNPDGTAKIGSEFKESGRTDFYARAASYNAMGTDKALAWLLTRSVYDQTETGSGNLYNNWSTTQITPADVTIENRRMAAFFGAVNAEKNTMLFTSTQGTFATDAQNAKLNFGQAALDEIAKMPAGDQIRIKDASGKEYTAITDDAGKLTLYGIGQLNYWKADALFNPYDMYEGNAPLRISDNFNLNQQSIGYLSDKGKVNDATHFSGQNWDLYAGSYTTSQFYGFKMPTQTPLERLLIDDMFARLGLSLGKNVMSQLSIAEMKSNLMQRDHVMGQLLFANPGKWSAEAIGLKNNSSDERTGIFNVFAKTGSQSSLTFKSVLSEEWGNGFNLFWKTGSSSLNVAGYDTGLRGATTISNMAANSTYSKYYGERPNKTGQLNAFAAYYATRFGDYELKASALKQGETDGLPGRTNAAVVFKWDAYRNVGISHVNDERIRVSQTLDANGKVTKEETTKQNFYRDKAGITIGWQTPIPGLYLSGFGLTSEKTGREYLGVSKDGQPITTPDYVKKYRDIEVSPDGTTLSASTTPYEQIRANAEMTVENSLLMGRFRAEYSVFPGNRAYDGWGFGAYINPAFDSHQYQFAALNNPMYNQKGVAMVSGAPSNFAGENSFGTFAYQAFEGLSASYNRYQSDNWLMTKTQGRWEMKLSGQFDLGLKGAVNNYSYSIGADKRLQANYLTNMYLVYNTATGSMTLGAGTNTWKTDTYKAGKLNSEISDTQLFLNLVYSVKF